MNWKENKDEKVKIANRDKPFEGFCKRIRIAGRGGRSGKLWKKQKKRTKQL